jgi:uncharacterized protein (TIGR00299 family) protein
MTRIAILDPFAGISGDMILGCLVGAGLDRAWLDRLPSRTGFPEASLSVKPVQRCSIAATRVDVHAPEQRHGPHSHHGRTLGELQEIVQAADLSEEARRLALQAFAALGEAEGKVHGVSAEQVHFHEVGAVDAVIDIVGAVDGFERLGVNAIYNLPVALGDGWVETAHGSLPVPAPATTGILSGISVSHGAPVSGEATTPTGAALLKTLSSGPPPVTWRLERVSWGAGSRDPEDYPNALRLIIAEGADEAALVEVVATDIDDMVPEYVEPLRSAVLAAGALDCVIWPTQGKKGRVSLRVESLVPAGAADAVIRSLFANSTTAGVRRWATSRLTLPRHEFQVELEGGIRVRIKVWEGPTGRRLKPEYDDVVRAAAALGQPALEVAREAERRAEARVQERAPQNGAG